MTEAGKTVQYPLCTISVNSTLRKSLYSVAEWCGPLVMLSILCWVDQGESLKCADAPEVCKP